MTDKKTAVMGIYAIRADAERGADALMKVGFPASEISVLLPDNLGGVTDLRTEKATKAPEGATTGGISGGAIGGVLGLLAGIGALAIPGVGPLIAAGPIMGVLAGAGVGGAVGGVVGGLIGMGIPEYEAKRYEGRIKSGGILLSVHCGTSDQIRVSKEVLKATGAEDISSTSEASVPSAEKRQQEYSKKAGGGSY